MTARSGILCCGEFLNTRTSEKIFAGENHFQSEPGFSAFVASQAVFPIFRPHARVEPKSSRLASTRLAKAKR